MIISNLQRLTVSDICDSLEGRRDFLFVMGALASSSIVYGVASSESSFVVIGFLGLFLAFWEKNRIEEAEEAFNKARIFFLETGDFSRIQRIARLLRI